MFEVSFAVSQFWAGFSLGILFSLMVLVVWGIWLAGQKRR